MKCLTVCQPWAWAIVEGLKRFENRVWATVYRGPLLIHAGRSRGWLDEGVHEIQSLGLSTPEDFDYGVILGRVDLVDCLRRASLPNGLPFAEGPFCWELGHPWKLAEPIPFRGKQSLFDVPDDIVAGATWIEQP